MMAWRRLPAVERRLVDGRLLVQPVDAAAPTELGGSAPLIWELLSHHTHVAEIMRALSTRFDDDPAVIEQGTRAAIEQMRAAGLIEESP